MDSIRSISIQYLLAISLASLTTVMPYLVDKIYPDIGYGMLTFLFVFIGIGLILFYFLTTFLTLGFSILSFALNFILWVAEQVNLESAFHDSPIYQKHSLIVTLIGGILWVTNKLIIDKIFELQKVKMTATNRINYFINKTMASKK